MEKHAFLIICHDNFEILKRILKLLDDERNDIYLHVDKRFVSFNKDEIEGILEKATLKIIARRKVNWGGYSLIDVELSLLKEATQKQHIYYHLLSGVDMPLKTQDEIHCFFHQNKGREFVSVDESVEAGNNINTRIKYYYLFQDHIGRIPGIKSGILERVERCSLAIQKFLKIDRVKKIGMPIYKGANWFSITHELALFVISQERKIKKLFKYSLCADELFLQTLVMNSQYKEKITNDCLRYIDWNRGTPYTFTVEDKEKLLESKKIFARKFDYWC